MTKKKKGSYNYSKINVVVVFTIILVLTTEIMSGKLASLDDEMVLP